MRVSAATRVFALLGDPVTHSLSPVLQNAAFTAAAHDAVYVALRCASGDVGAIMRTLVAAGGGGNVTLPHKAAAAAGVARTTAAVERTGACNTFWAEDGILCGDNTDVAGFRAASATLLGDMAGVRVLLLGAGGAAAAAACALLDARAATILVHSRTASRAAALCATLDPGGLRMRTADTLPRDVEVVINATSLGLRADDPLPPLPPGCRAALDLVYRAGETAWVRHARERGVTAADGRLMLLHQAAAAYERWWREPARLDVMRRVLAVELDTPQPGAAQSGRPQRP